MLPFGIQPQQASEGGGGRGERRCERSCLGSRAALYLEGTRGNQHIAIAATPRPIMGRDKSSLTNRMFSRMAVAARCVQHSNKKDHYNIFGIEFSRFLGTVYPPRYNYFRIVNPFNLNLQFAPACICTYIYMEAMHIFQPGNYLEQKGSLYLEQNFQGFWEPYPPRYIRNYFRIENNNP